MSDDVVYFNQMIWSHSDKLVSSANLNIDKFVAKDNWGMSPPRLKFTINHYKTKTNIQITLSHQEVFNFLIQFKKYETMIPSIIKEISEDQNKQYTFSIKNKKFLFVTFLFKSEYGGACIRVVISDKNSDYLDSEKIYLPIYDFLSLIVVMGQFRNNYVSTVDSMTLLSSLSELNQKISDIDSKLVNYYSEFTAKNKLIENELRLQKESIPTEYSPFPSLDDISTETKLAIIKESLEKTQNPSSSSSSNNEVVEEVDMAEIHDQLSSFIKKESDSFDIGLTDTAPVKAVTENAVVLPKTFTEKMLVNDLSNLEMYMMNLVNDDLPFSKFSELIKTKLGFDALEGISQVEENSVDYMTSIFLKSIVKDSLDKKQEIPSSIPPIVFDKVNSNENKISLAYDLYLYCIYYSHLRNILKDKDYGVVANKELVTFALKTISSPYVFSLVKHISEPILIAELLNRYRKYHEAGVFDTIEKNILETRSINVTISEETIKSEASRIYNVIVQRWDSLTVESSFKGRSCILQFDDFKKNKLSKEQIKKILAVEFSFKKNKVVDFKEAGINGFDDIPLSISEKYGIIKQKFDNTNLKRFVKEKCKDNESLYKKCIEIVELVNESYKDLVNKNVDFSVIPEEILKAIALWDLKMDSKVSTSYIHLLEQVQKSTLSRDMIISMLLNISNASDSDFTKSFIAARDE